MSVSAPEMIKNIFEPELVKLIEDNGKYMHVKEGEILLNIGQNIRFIPILISGIIKIMRTDEDGKEIFLYYLSPSESCAMTFTCCMEYIPSEVKAIAEEDSEIITLPIDLMNDWMGRFPTWRSFVLATIRDKYNELLKTIDQIAFKALDVRLKNYLLAKSSAINTTLLNISHEEIANDLGTSRVVISRLLKQLENEQKVLLYRQQIKLLHAL